MALLVEPGAEPLTESEQADLAGTTAIKESSACEFKEQSNQFVRMGRKHYAEAVSSYTKVIAQIEPLSSLDDADASVLFANRAHVNLLLRGGQLRRRCGPPVGEGRRGRGGGRDEEDEAKRRRVVKAPTLTELTIEDEELRWLRRLGMILRDRITMPKAGVTTTTTEKIHDAWSKSELVRLKFHKDLAHSMKTAHELVK